MNYLPMWLNLVLVFFLSIFLFSGKITAANLDSLSQAKEDLGASSISYLEDHFKLGIKFFLANEYEKATQEFNLVLKHSKEIGNFEMEIFAYCKLGLIEKRRGNNEAALDLLRVVENVSESSAILDSCKTIAQGYLGNIYQLLGDYDKAYDYQLKVLQVYEAKKDSVQMGKTVYHIGTIFYYQKNYKQALSYYELALTYVKRLPDIESKKMVFNSLSAIGSTYERMGKMGEALTFNLEALKLAKEMDYSIGIAYAMLNSGTASLANRYFGRASTYLKQAEKLMISEKDRWGLGGVYQSLAELYIESGAPKKSIVYLELALPIAEELDSKVRFLEIYDFFAQAHKELGNYEEAHNYLNKYIELKQKVLNETTLKEMGNQKTRYEVQKKESEIVLLKKENDLLEKDQQIGKLYRWIWIGAALFLLLLLSLSFSRYKVQKQSNNLLSEKNKEINLQKEQLEEANEIQANTNTLLEDKNIQIELQNKQLEDSNEDLKQFAYVASHDLKEPLRMISSYTSILKKRYNPLFDDDAHEFMGYIVDAVGRMETLLSDLLVYSRVSTQENTLKEIEIKDVVDVVMGNLRYSIEQKGAKVFVNSDGLPRIKANHTQMMQLFQNLMSNAIKFTKKSDPQVHVDCTKETDHYLFSIKDNGIGIKPENKDKIFEMFKRLHTKEEFEGTGIGLATCKKIVDRHGGNIWVESEPGEGSTFYFKIPLLLEATAQVDNQNKLIQEMSN